LLKLIVLVSFDGLAINRLTAGIFDGYTSRLDFVDFSLNSCIGRINSTVLLLLSRVSILDFDLAFILIPLSPDQA